MLVVQTMVVMIWMKKSVLVSLGCHHPVPQTRWLNNKFIFSQFQRPEVPEQGAAELVSGGTSLPPLQTAVSSLCPHMAFGKRKISGISSSFYKDISCIRLGTHPMTSFNINYSLKALSPNTITLGVRLQHMNLGGGRCVCVCVCVCNSIHNKLIKVYWINELIK